MTQGEALILEGPVTMQSVPALAEQIPSMLNAGVRRIDFANVTVVDSAAVALALEWRRLATARNLPVTFLNLPETLQNLANLYGVTDVITPPAA